MVSIIKLIDGTEVVGNIVYEDKSSVQIQDPLQINYRTRPDTLPAIYLYRFVPFSKQKTFEIKQEHVMSKVEPIENLTRYYNVVLKAINDNFDQLISEELANAAIESGSDELSEEEMVKLALQERKAFKITLN